MSLAPIFQDTHPLSHGSRSKTHWIGGIQLTGWLLAGGILLLHFALQPQAVMLHSVFFTFLSIAVLVMLTTAAGLTYRHCLRWPVHCQFATALLGSAVITLVALSLVNLLASKLANLNGVAIRDNFSVFLLLVLTWSALYFVVGHCLLSLSRQRQDTRIARQSHQSQLRVMEQQLNPHFLFNTLNAISTQILKRDMQAARGTLNQLAAFLRKTLHVPGEKKNSLDEELSVAMMYLDIEKTRFAARLRVWTDVDEQVKNARVPSLILLPLLAHAIKTAIARMTHGGEISIQATRHNNLLQLQVADNGPDAEMEFAGITSEATYTEQLTFRDTELQVVAQRLAALYPKQHIFRIEKNQPSGLRVVMMIPYEEP